MSRAIRVGMKADRFIIMVLETDRPIQGAELSVDEAADLYTQLGLVLPKDKLNAELGSSDQDMGESGEETK